MILPSAVVGFVFIKHYDNTWLLEGCLLFSHCCLNFNHFLFPLLITLNSSYVCMIVSIHNFVIMVRLVDDNWHCSCNKNMRTMIIVEIIFNSSKHAILVFIWRNELGSQQILMEIFRGVMNLLLIAKYDISRFNTLREFELESLLFLAFLFEKKLFSFTHKSSRARLLEYVVDWWEL